MSAEVLRIYKEKLEALQIAEAKASDPAQTFKLQQDIAELRAKLAAFNAGTEAGETPDPGADPRLQALLTRTLCAKLNKAHQTRAARDLIAFLRDQTRLDADDLFRAARYLVEHRLLTAKEKPHCALGPDGKAVLAGGQKGLLKVLKQQVQPTRKKAPFQSPRVELTPGSFLQRAQDRADDWSAYFTALVSPDVAALDPSEVKTLSRIEVTGGAVAPQYLLAGLMSHFQNDWRPVIDGYTNLTRRDVDGGSNMLERLKASQWICWLVWGPSIPACTCTHWQPEFAYQFGYGDENNSLPACLAMDPALLKTLLSDQAYGDRRAIEVKKVTARLTWGPLAFPDGARLAPAQARLTTEPGDDAEDRADTHPSDRLLLKIVEVEPRDAQPNEPAYFTAYIWLMFWIAGAAADDARIARRLNGRRLPEPGDAMANRDRMRRERLWDDLLPVFVHGNILDPVVLRSQKGTLIENALHLLKRIWDDHWQGDSANRSAIQFHLACASDYTGCGCQITFPAPPDESLVELMRARLARVPEQDQDFARAVRLPDANETAETRPPAYRAFLSACHLPDMIDGYYQELKQEMDRARRMGE
jgi:hypothetical protein